MINPLWLMLPGLVISLVLLLWPQKERDDLPRLLDSPQKHVADDGSIIAVTDEKLAPRALAISAADRDWLLAHGATWFTVEPAPARVDPRELTDYPTSVDSRALRREAYSRLAGGLTAAQAAENLAALFQAMRAPH